MKMFRAWLAAMLVLPCAAFAAIDRELFLQLLETTKHLVKLDAIVMTWHSLVLLGLAFVLC